MHVLVTGGAGFVGSHIVDTLLRAGHEVGVVDDLSTGIVKHVPTSVPLYRLSIGNPAALSDVFAGTRWNAVVHCAAQIKVHRSMDNPAMDREINLVGTANVLDAARAHGVERFIFLSTGGAIYGETPNPATEETVPSPKSFYGVHKLAAESYVAFSGIPSVSLRLSNVYGPRQRSDLEGGVVNIFAERLIGGREIEIHGTGEQVRDFVYVGDVADAVQAALEHDLHGVYNVATGTETTLNQLLATLVEIVGREPVAVRHGPARQGDIFRSCLDVQKLVGTGYWTPKYDLRRGLAESVASLAAV